MKALILTLSLTSAIAGAATVPWYKLEATAVTCKSGAPVNSEVTVSPGFKIETGKLPEEMTHVSGDAYHMEYQILNDQGYSNGHPPCPLGDYLEMDWKIQTCEIVNYLQYDESVKCD